ncbi:VOC family protein [Lysobacter firmicutimachus]|uniref:VOC family protein n=1 Tax=Lysobacter firmicutimachus TaxID=1792846 RepID=A0AAU8MQB4_9GAMM
MKTQSKPSIALSLALGGALLLGAGPAAAGPAATPASPAAGSDIDHALVWGRRIDEITSAMTVKLGFQVRPGRTTGGVANRYVRFGDRSYLELFAIEGANPQFDPGMRADQKALRGGVGAHTFGLRSAALDAAHDQLRRQRFAVTPLFTAAADDPDGDGAGHPPRWRLFSFDAQPLSSNLFFIDYAALAATPERAIDLRVGPQHPNGALALSGLWLLSADVEADRKQFERMGFTGMSPVRLPQIAARGYCVPVGGKRVLALQPDGEGAAADALRRRGPQLLGVSIAVADLQQARWRVERGYETRLPGYRGAWGEAFLAPTVDDLGLLVEFHAAPQAGPACGNAGHSLRAQNHSG